MEIINFSIVFNNETLSARIEVNDDECTLEKFVQIGGNWINAADLAAKKMLPLYVAIQKLPFVVKEGDIISL